VCFALEGKRDRLGREDPVAGSEDPNDQRRPARTPPGHSSPPDQTSEDPPDRSVVSQEEDHTTTPVDATPESGAPSESEESTKELLAAYQETRGVVEELPAIVWLRWGRKGLGRFLKIPYLRWFLGYFLTYHIRERLNTLNRCFYANDALADDPDSNKANLEAINRYLQSLPPTPYKRLTLAFVFAALLVALPLHNFGNAIQVLDIVGALMTFNISLLGAAFAAQEFWATVRAMLVLLLALCVVASLLTSPYALKRTLFNLYPGAKERLGSTAARDHTWRVTGLYALEERVFREVGLPRPKEGRWDLLFQTFVLMLLLLFGGMALVIAMSAEATLEVTSGVATLVVSSIDPANVSLIPPDVLKLLYALLALIFFIAFVVLLKRIIIAWRRRNRPARL
jgi:hypothetical protein